MRSPTDLGVDAVKIGMLGDVATIEAVAAALDGLAPGTPIVHDPVMVAESGARLLALDAVAALREQILPRATVITPNLAEARALAGDDTLDGIDLVRALHALGPAYVVVTGGHRDSATDLFFDGTTLTELPGERHRDGAAHGSGCTHSATLAARLALGDSPLDAARHARAVAGRAVADGLRDLGAGAGPGRRVRARARAGDDDDLRPSLRPCARRGLRRRAAAAGDRLRARPALRSCSLCHNRFG